MDEIKSKIRYHATWEFWNKIKEVQTELKLRSANDTVTYLLKLGLEKYNGLENDEKRIL